MITPHKPPMLPCPICGRAVPVSNVKFLPFCSDRCRLIDLGRWLDEEHSVPATAAEEDESNSDSAMDDRPRSIDTEEPERRAPPRLPPGWHDA